MRKIGLIFGGPSNEHDVSISSAKNINTYIDKTKYNLILIYWDRQGNFFIVKSLSDFSSKISIHVDEFKKYFDIALLMTHGKYGEDGKLQSILGVCHIPYCGCRVLPSALCMDKGMFKTFLMGHNIKQVAFAVLDLQLDGENGIQNTINSFVQHIPFPIYVKPANSGSSVGITKVTNISELDAAIEKAALHDQRILLEQGLIRPKEIEVAIIGNKILRISEPGELHLAKDFYDYDDKYIHNQAAVNIPANIPPSQKEEIHSLAQQAYRLCNCSGFARIDFFLSEGNIYLNEINTLPGFTDISMFPMLMKHTGLTFGQIIDEIINLAY